MCSTVRWACAPLSGGHVSHCQVVMYHTVRWPCVTLTGCNVLNGGFTVLLVHDHVSRLKNMPCDFDPSHMVKRFGIF